MTSTHHSPLVTPSPSASLGTGSGRPFDKFRGARSRGALRAFSLLPPLAAAALLLLCACPDDTKLVHGCTADTDCGDVALYRCDVETAECRCRTNDACKVGEFCNTQGYCQAHVGCYETRDCPDGFFCDPKTNLCLAIGRCATDLNCPLGSLCDLSTSTCKAGCRSHGDCDANAHEACVCAATGSDAGVGAEALCTCDATSDEGRASCPIGRCVSGTCADNSWCSWGEVCKAPTAADELAKCQSDYDNDLRPYCANCVYAPGQDA